MTFTIANLNLDSGYTSKLGNLKTEDKQNLEDMVKLFVSMYGIDKAEPSNY